MSNILSTTHLLLMFKQSQALLNAIKEYETNKWKVIGAKVGKPAKVRYCSSRAYCNGTYTRVGLRTVCQGEFRRSHIDPVAQDIHEHSMFLLCRDIRDSSIVESSSTTIIRCTSTRSTLGWFSISSSIV